MDRKLKLNEEGLWETEGMFNQPAVLESQDDDGDMVYQPTYNASLETIDDQLHIGIASVNGTRYYPIDKVEDVKINDSSTEITFSSYGRIYKVRPFQDSDGSWASQLGIDVPADSLEERYMAEISTAFSPNAPADDENLYAAVDEDTNEVKYLVYSTDSGMYIRNKNAWFRLPKDDESLDDLTVVEVNSKFIKIYDMSEGNDESLLLDDIGKYEVDFRNPNAVTASAEFAEDDEYGGKCPPATQDIELNLKNRQNAIDNVGYGPLNPAEPNDEFWQEKADKWKTDIEQAKTSICGNCAFFVRTVEVLDCIADGIGMENENEGEWGSIQAGELGYCNALDFKCAADRTCNAWAAGGPVVDTDDEESK